MKWIAVVLVALTLAQILCGFVLLYVWGFGGSLPDNLGAAVFMGTMITAVLGVFALMAWADSEGGR